jgi:hypothetical protein
MGQAEAGRCEGLNMANLGDLLSKPLISLRLCNPARGATSAGHPDLIARSR